MDIRYPAYCAVDPRYYDAPENVRESNQVDGYRDLVQKERGWQENLSGPWVRWRPEDVELPEQGWKIHVSATPENAQEMLKIVSSYCFEHQFSFKFLRNPSVLMQYNSKYAPRQSSGKFIVLYPENDEKLGKALEDLDASLGCAAGPSILSDLRWRKGPLYLRYGSFIERYVFTDRGTQVPALKGPDGQLEPDRRLPTFQLPAWAPRPPCLADAVANRLDASPAEEDFPYTDIRPLHFSNGGGVYAAIRRADGLPIVLKEARPHAGLDHQLRDAVARLDHEERAMRALAGIKGVPKVYARHSLGGHAFLEQEHMPGISFHSWVAVHHPRVTTRDDEASAEVHSFQQRVRTILDQVDQIVRDVNARGWLFRDLHPGNVLVDDELSVSLIDYEIAVPVSEAGHRSLGAAGFAAPAVVNGAEEDAYALAAMQLFAYLPLNSLLTLASDKAEALIDFVRVRFPLNAVEERRLAPLLDLRVASPADVTSDVPADAFDPARTPWTSTRDKLAAGILASATPHRDDRLFPGDIAQFQHQSLGIAYGAAGVLDSLRQAGQPVHQEHVEWMIAQARRNRSQIPGLYDGLCGPVYVLAGLGRFTESQELFEPCLTASVTGIKLHNGLSGIGLTALLLHSATGRDVYRSFADDVADQLRTSVEQGSFLTSQPSSGGPAPVSLGPSNAPEGFDAGLMYGWSGVALFLLQHFATTGDERDLDSARHALDRDLSRCEIASDGALLVRNGGRLLPYLATGGAGIALVAGQWLRHRTDKSLDESVAALARGLLTDQCICSGLFNGHAGILYAQHCLRPWLADTASATTGAAALDSLALHALRDGAGFVFPGEQNLRLSMDVATGSAGILRLLTSLATPGIPLLPFLPTVQSDTEKRGCRPVLTGRQQPSPDERSLSWRTTSSASRP